MAGNNRITWQSVAAPNFDDAIRARNSGATLFDSAFKTLGDTFSGIGERQNEQASAAAMARALGITDTAQWDQAMANGGLEALGISARQATPEFMQFLSERRGDLLGNDATLANIDSTVASTGLTNANIGLVNANTDQTRVDTSNSIANNAREQATHDRDIRETDYDFGRKVQTDVVNDEYKADVLAAQEQIMGEVLRGDRVYTDKDELRSQWSKSGMSAAELKIRNDALSQIPDTVFETSPEAQRTVGLTESSIRLNERLGLAQQELSGRQGSDQNMRLWEMGSQNYTGADIGPAALMSRLSDRYGPEGRDVLENSASQITRYADALLKDPELKNVPPEVVLQAIENTLEGDTWLLGMLDGEDLRLPDMRDVKRKLKPFTDPKEFNKLSADRNEYRKASIKLEDYQKKGAKAEAKMARALTQHGSMDHPEVQRYARQLAAIEADMASDPVLAAYDDGNPATRQSATFPGPEDFAGFSAAELLPPNAAPAAADLNWAERNGYTNRRPSVGPQSILNFR